MIFLSLCIFVNTLSASVWWSNNFQLTDANTLGNAGINVAPNPYTSVVNSNNEYVVNYSLAPNNEYQAKINGNQRWHGNPIHLTVYLQSVDEYGNRYEDYSCHVNQDQTIDDTCY